jgi:hypothetical protein
MEFNWHAFIMNALSAFRAVVAFAPLKQPSCARPVATRQGSAACALPSRHTLASIVAAHRTVI